MKIEYSKWDGRRHWHFDVTVLGDDDYGTWYAAPVGGLIQRGDEPPFRGPGWACLVPHDGLWIAHFGVDRNPEGVYVYINVTDEPRRTADRVMAIDLDLDVVGWRDGRVDLEDREEFETHIDLFGYPASTVVAARETSEELVEAVSSRREPFARASEPWGRRVIGM